MEKITYFDKIPQELRYEIGYHLEIDDIYNFEEYLDNNFWHFWLLIFRPSIQKIKIDNKEKIKNLVVDLLEYRKFLSTEFFLSSEQRYKLFDTKYCALLGDYRLDSLIDLEIKSRTFYELIQLMESLYLFNNDYYTINYMIPKCYHNPKFSDPLIILSILNNNFSVIEYTIECTIELSDEIEDKQILTTLMMAAIFFKNKIFIKNFLNNKLIKDSQVEFINFLSRCYNNIPDNIFDSYDSDALKSLIDNHINSLFPELSDMVYKMINNKNDIDRKIKLYIDDNSFEKIVNLLIYEPYRKLYTLDEIRKIFKQYKL